MSRFSCLVRYELKKNFRSKDRKKSIFDSVLSILLTSIVIITVCLLFYNIADTYIHIKFNKQYDVLSRSQEIFNIFNIILIISLFVFSIEKQRRMITLSQDKPFLLRLPVKPEEVNLAKFVVIYIENFIISFICYLAFLITFSLVTSFNAAVVLKILVISLTIPNIAIFFSTMLVVPYSFIVDFIKNRPILTLISFIAILTLGIFLYLDFLNVLRILLETGSIKHLFDEAFVNNMSNILKYNYILNNLTYFVFNTNILNTIIIVLFNLFSIVIGILVTRFLFMKTLYIREKRTRVRKNLHVRQLKPTTALLKKEFVEISRNPKLLFTFFAFALSVPIMVVGTSSIFSKLVYNSLGLKLDFEVCFLVSLIFVSLINSFSSNLISKDGVSFFKYKSYPISLHKILISKVLLNIIISTFSLVILLFLLIFSIKLEVVESLVIFLSLLLLSVSQILIGIKLDLKHSKLSNDQLLNEKVNSKNQSFIVGVYLLISLLFGTTVLVLAILNFFYKLNIDTYILLFIVLGTIISFVVSVFSYRHKLEYYFNSCGCEV